VASQNKENEKDVRQDNFGDDGGTRVGRPDSAARLSENSENGLEGKILEKGPDEETTQGENQSKVQRESGRDR
jgi:hypothetical protein